MKPQLDNIKLEIGGQPIERIGNDCKTKYFKFVGIMVDEFINWNYQRKHIISKLAASNYIIARENNYLPEH